MPSDARRQALAAGLEALRLDPFDSMRDSIGVILDEEGPDSLVAAVVDAIPPGVLAQLAIDRGGLQQVTTYHDARCDRDGSPVYRLTEDAELRADSAINPVGFGPIARRFLPTSGPADA